MKNGDYGNYLKFADGILSKYQSVVIDPDCEKLKPSYIMIQKTVQEIRLRFQEQTGQSLSCSLKRNEELNDRLYKSESISRAYGFVQGLVFRTKRDGSYKKVIEEEQREAFVIVMGSLDIDSVSSFIKRYPGIYESDMRNILSKAKDKLKVSVMRNATKQNLKSYLRYFPEKDKVIEAAYEDALYNEFKSNQSVINAQEYLVNYPEGKYKTEVKGCISGMNTAIIYDSSNIVNRQ